MDDPRWPNKKHSRRRINPARLARELAQAPGLEAEEDELGNAQAGFRIELLGEGEGFDLYLRDGVPDEVVQAVLDAHDPTPDPEPEPPARPIEELNAAIQAATGLADVKQAFATFTDRYGDRL